MYGWRWGSHQCTYSGSKSHHQDNMMSELNTERVVSSRKHEEDAMILEPESKRIQVDCETAAMSMI